MVKLKIENVSYYFHPIYDAYAASRNGNIVYFNRKVPMKGNKTHYGYLSCRVRKRDEYDQKYYLVHRFVWECFNGIIPKDMIIVHINDDKEDNRLCNLRLMTQREKFLESKIKREKIEDDWLNS